MDYIKIEHRNRRLISTILSNEPCVLFVGSAISRWDPSNVPTGQSIRQTIYDLLDFDLLLREEHGNLPQYLTEILSQFPFELLTDRCPLRSKLQETLYSFYSSFHIPNPVHKKIANMLMEGKVDSIITPNYDTCLENAIYQVDPDFKFSTVSTFEQLRNQPSKNIIFKIHGSVDDNNVNSIIFMMRQEGKLTDWKQKLFRKLVTGKTVVVIGYSGFDFDICPEFSLAKPKKIYWNFLSEDKVSLNAVEVSKKIDTSFLIGDMRKLIDELGFPLEAKYGNDYDKYRESLKNAILGEIPDIYRKLWRLKIINSISFNEVAIKTSDNLVKDIPNESYLVELLSERATALSNGGWYKQSAKVYEEAAQIAKKNKFMRDFSVKSDLAAHSWLSYGNYFNFWIWNRKSKKTTEKSQVSYGFESNEIQAIRDLYRLIKKWNVPFLMNIIRKYAHSRIEDLGPKIHELGNWHGISRLQKLAADFDISSNEISILGEYDVDPIELAYKRVSMPIGQMTAYRKSVEFSKSCKTVDEYMYGKSLLKQAISLGIYAEVWKIAIVLDSYYDNYDNHSEEFWLGFNKCEYSKFKRKTYYRDASKKVNYL